MGTGGGVSKLVKVEEDGCEEAVDGIQGVESSGPSGVTKRKSGAAEVEPRKRKCKKEDHMSEWIRQ